MCCGLLGCSAQCGLSRGRAEALQPAPQAHHGSRNHLHAHNHTCRWGNRKSLVEDPAAAGIDVRGELLKYYRYAVFATVSVCVLLGRAEGRRGRLQPQQRRQVPACVLRSRSRPTHRMVAGRPACTARREQYSAERMNLVVLGGEGLDTLQEVGGRLPVVHA